MSGAVTRVEKYSGSPPPPFATILPEKAVASYIIPHGDVEVLMKNEKMDVEDIVYLAKKLAK